ncbi:MAG: hypothetical protein R3A78_06555 [Polyangiales bacterium]
MTKRSHGDARARAMSLLGSRLTSVAATAAVVLAAAPLVGCETEAACAPAELGALKRAPDAAVVTSLFRESSAIALLAGDHELLTEAWLDSGSAPAGVTSALGGDVVLPTVAHPGELVLVERRGVDLITRIDLGTGKVLGQHSAQHAQAGSGAAYRSNAQDALRLSATEILVSRHEPNFDDDPDPLDGGNDLVRIDLGRNEIVERIALDHLNDEVDGMTIYARPSRMVRIGTKIVIGLARLSEGFDVAGTGMVAVLDVSTRKATPIALEGLSNCGEVRPVLGDDTRVLVLCAGETFSDADGRRAEAGLVLLESDGSALRVAAVWKATDHPTLPPPQFGAVSLGGARFVYESLSIDADRSDALVAVDITSGEGETIDVYPLDGGDARLQFNLGPGAFLPDEDVLLVPLATGGVLRWKVTDALAPSPLETLDPSPCRSLPAREIALLRP